MEIQVNKEIVIQEKITETIEKVTVINVYDDLKSKVSCDISIGAANNRYLVLWENEDYTAIGNWTDEDVKKRIIEMI